MGKPRMYGARSAYVPNAHADARRKKKFYEHGKAFADNDEARHAARFEKEKKKWKEKQQNDY